MKRILCSAILIACLLAALLQPVFAAEGFSVEELLPVETSVQESAEPSEETPSTEAAEETLFPEATEETAAQAEAAATYSVQTYTVSEQGRAFISEMMGGSFSESQLAAAETAVNSFIAAYSLSLDQQKFDALADLVMNYGDYILTSGYRVERVIGSGDYTELDVANALCSWVSEGGSFSQTRLNRRLREIKLFLYGSYDGICEASFRYVIFNANGGSLDDNTVLCYPLYGTYSNLPTASRSGYYFAGWYTASTGGTHVLNSDTVGGNQSVYAHWSEGEIEAPNDNDSVIVGNGEWPPLPALKTSEDCIAFIKAHEGFVAYPIADYGQYTIGYGTRYDPNNAPIPISTPITEEEADYLLRHMLASFEQVVDAQFAKGTVEHTQAQYDAVISFTFNLGQQWINSDYKIYQYILHGGYTEMEFVNTIGKWCNAGGSVLTGLARRRMDEANMYLNGDYTKGTSTYFFLQFNGCKGESSEKYRYYKTGEPLGSLPTATRKGYYLTGWYDKVSGGNQYTTETTAPSYVVYTVYAQWAEGEDPNQPPAETDPPEETEPPVETAPPEETDPPKETDPPVDVPTEGFTDVPADAWFYEPVTLAVEAGLFSGVSENEFQPDGTMSRAMLATVLYRMSGEECSSGHPFTDVPEGTWYSDAIAWAYEKGIVKGVSETEFGVEEDVSRQQLVVMLQRYADYRGYDSTQSIGLTDFADADQVAEYALPAVQWAVACGIVNGSDGLLSPNGSATRAQCAKMLMCFLELYRQPE